MLTHTTVIASLPEGVGTLTELARWAQDRELTSVWAIEGVLPDVPSFYWPQGEWRVFPTVEPNEAPRDVAYRVETGSWGSTGVLIHRLGPNSPWPWGAAHDAGQVLMLVHNYSVLLRCTPSYSPSSTARDLLVRQWQHQAWWPPRPLAPAIEELLPAAQAALWTSAQEPTARYRHAYDRNSAYLSVAASVSFGLGQPTRATTFDPKSFGLWNIQATSDSPWDGHNLPGPFGHELAYEGWAYTPTVRLAQALGWQVQIGDGLVWTSRHQLFRDWAALVYQARGQAKDEPLLKEAMSRTYRVTLGQLALSDPYAGSKDRWYHQPHWRGYLVAEQQRQVLMKLQEAVALGHTPLAVKTDAIVLASDEADPAQVIPGILNRATGLGGWRLDYCHDTAGVA